MSSGSGGSISITAGATGASRAQPAQGLASTSAAGVVSGAGGTVTVTTGTGGASNGNGGDIHLDPGAGGGSGAYGRVFLAENGGTVGIGTTSPSSPLTVNGVVESLSGGFKFPDGTTQTTAGGGLGLQGSLIATSASGCAWNSTAASWTTLTTPVSNCTSGTVAGSASLPTEGKIAAIRFASLAAGTYKVSFYQFAYAHNTGTCGFRVTDGTNFGPANTVSSSAYGLSSNLVGLFTYATSQTNIEFYIQAKANSGATCVVTSNTSDSNGMYSDLGIIVERCSKETNRIGGHVRRFERIQGFSDCYRWDACGKFIGAASNCSLRRDRPIPGGIHRRTSSWPYPKIVRFPLGQSADCRGVRGS